MLGNVVLEQVQAPLSLSRSDSAYTEYSLRDAMPAGSAAYEAQHVAHFGDWDQDGTSDLVIGLPMLSTVSSEAGGAAIVLLDSDGSWRGFGNFGTGSRTALLANGNGGLGVAALAAGSRHGHSVVGNIDLDGNGVGDLVMAAPFASSWSAQRTGGLHFVLLTANAGLPWASSHSWFSPVDAVDVRPTSFQMGCNKTNGTFGTAVARAGDLDGDGIDDLLVNAGLAGSDAQLYVLFLKRNGTFVRTWHELVATGGSAAGVMVPRFHLGRIDKFSSSSDLFSDGNPDFAMALETAPDAFGQGAGAIWLFSVGMGGKNISNHSIVTRGLDGLDAALPHNGTFGADLAVVPDQTGDGIEELLVVVSHQMLVTVPLSASGVAGAPILGVVNRSTQPHGQLFGGDLCGTKLAAFRLGRSQGIQVVVACSDDRASLLWYRPAATGELTRVLWAPTWAPLGEFDFAAAYKVWPVTVAGSGLARLTSHPHGGQCFPSVLTLNSPGWAAGSSGAGTFTVRLMPRSGTGQAGAAGGLAWRILDQGNFLHLEMTLASPTSQKVWLWAGATKTQIASFACDLAAAAAQEASDLATVQVVSHSNGTQHIFCGRDAIIARHPALELQQATTNLGKGVGVWASNDGNVDFDDFEVVEPCDSSEGCKFAQTSQTCSFKCASGFRQTSQGAGSVECSAGGWVGEPLRCSPLPPTIQGEVPPFDRSVLETARRGTPVGGPVAVSTGAATMVPSWRIVAGNGPSNDWFSIGRCDGQLRVNEARLDFEGGLGSTPVVVTAGVSPNGDLTAEVVANYSVQALDANEAPVWLSQPLVTTVSEDAEVGSLLQPSLFNLTWDPESDLPQFQIIGGDALGTFAIRAVSGHISLARTVNFEAQPYYDLRIRAVDPRDPKLWQDALVRVDVVDVNEAPVFVTVVAQMLENEISLSVAPKITDLDYNQRLSLSIPESGPWDSPAFEVLRVGGVDVIQVRSSHASLVDFESSPVLRFQLVATDSGLPALSSSANITVSLIDVNEAPDVSWPGSTLEVPENSPAGTKLFTFDYSDQDWPAQGLEWHVSSPDLPNAFRFVNNVLEVQQGALLDYEGTAGPGPFDIAVTATDSGLDSKSASRTIQVAITNVNEPPSIESGQSFSVGEHAAAGTAIGTVRIVDPDAADAGKHALLVVSDEADGNAVAVPAGSTNLSVAPGGGINFELRRSHEVTLQVVDPAGLRGEGSVVVVVLDMEDVPRFSQAQFTAYISKHAPQGFVVLELGLADEDEPLGNAASNLRANISAGNELGDFAVDSSGTLTLRSTARPLLPGKRFLTIEAIDPEGNIGRCAAEVLIAGGTNSAPIAAKSIRSVAENARLGTLVGAPLEASDPDSVDRLYFSILSGNTGSVFELDGLSGQLKVGTGRLALDHEATPVFHLRVRVTDDAPEPLSTDFGVDVSVLNVNEPPSIEFGRAVHVGELSPAGTVVARIRATDPDQPDTLSFSIVSGDPRGRFTVETSTGVLRLAATVDRELQAVHTLGLRVADAGGEAALGNLIVLVDDENDAPELDDTSMTLSEALAPGSSLSYPMQGVDEDPGTSLSYAFVRDSDSDACWALSTTKADDPEWSPFPFDLPTAWTDWRVLRLRVATASDVVISLAASPSSDVPGYQPLPVARVGLSSKLPGTRFSGVCHESSAPSAHSRFSIEASTGLVTLLSSGPALDFEQWSTFGMLVKATDNGVPAKDAYGTLLLTVEDANEPPVWPSSPSKCAGISVSGIAACVSIRESASAGTPLQGVLLPVDPDAGQTVELSLPESDAANAATAARFALSADRSTLVVRDGASLDHETEPLLLMQVTATDSASPPQSVTATIGIAVLNSNERPVWASSGSLARSVAENSPAGTPVGSPLFATDPDLGDLIKYAIVEGGEETAFEIGQSTGQLSVAQGTSLDFEATSEFSVVVEATDSGGLSSRARVAVSVTDVNERPHVSAATRTVSEAAAVGTMVGAPIPAQDPDAGQALTFWLAQGDGIHFAIDRCTGQLSLKAALDFEAQAAHTITVHVADDARGGPLEASANVTVLVADANEAPLCPATAQTLAGPEDLLVGDAFGSEIDVRDQDANDTLTLALVDGAEAGVFALNASSRQLVVAKALLDYESPAFSQFALSFRATDSKGLSSVCQLQAVVQDVNEPPSLWNASSSISETTAFTPHAAGEPVGEPLTASDPEGGSLTFQLIEQPSANSTGLFELDAVTGQLRLTASGAAGLDFEGPSQSYTVPVRVLDDGSPQKSADAQLVVSVLNVNEPPFTPQNALRVSVRELAAPGAVVINGSSLGVRDGETKAFEDLRFSIVSGNSAGLWAIAALGGDVTYSDANTLPLDFEAVAPTHSLEIQVADNGAPGRDILTSRFSLVISVENVNEPPAAVMESASLSVREDSGDGTVAGVLGCTDPDADGGVGAKIELIGQDQSVSAPSEPIFEIGTTDSILTVRRGRALDADTQPEVAITVRCRDSHGAVSPDTTFSVAIINVNEPPIWQDVPTIYGAAATLGGAGPPLSDFCADPDVGDALSFSLESVGGNASAFGIDSRTGQVRVVDVSGQGAGSINDPEAEFRLNVSASDKDGLSAWTTVVVSTAAGNALPALPESSAPRVMRVPEAAADGALVATISGTDSDHQVNASHVLTYTMSPTGASAGRPFPFRMETIPEEGGVGSGRVVVQLPVAGLAQLDYEGLWSEFSVVISATDNGVPPMTASYAAVILISDSAEPPRLTQVSSAVTGSTHPFPGMRLVELSVAEALDAGEQAAMVLAADPDASSAGQLRFQLSNESSHFNGFLVVDPATGALETVKPLDFEGLRDPSSAGGQLEVGAVITVRDGNTTDALADSAWLRITVVDVNEAPTVDAVTLMYAPETLAPGSVVGTVGARDQDSGASGRLQFWILPSTPTEIQNRLRVDSVTGDVVLGSAGFDFEDTPEFNFTVVAQDSDLLKPLSTTTLVSVRVVNEPDIQVLGIHPHPSDKQCTVLPCSDTAQVDLAPREPGHQDLARSSTGLFFTPVGGARVLISGTGFGFSQARLDRDGLFMRDVAIEVTYGPTGTEYTARLCRVQEAGVLISCYTVRNWGGNHVWRVHVVKVGSTVIGDVAQSTVTTAAMPPRIYSVQTTHHGLWPVGGPVAIDMYGFGFGQFGDAVEVQCGGSNADQFAVYTCMVADIDQRHVQCASSAPGYGANLTFSVTVEGLRSAVFQSTVGFESPEVYGVRLLDSNSSSQLRSSGGQVLVVSGRYFTAGQAMDVIRVSYGTGLTLYEASRCSVTDADRELQCLTAPGVGLNHTLVVSVAGQRSDQGQGAALPQLLVSYAPPAVWEVTGTGALSASTAGGEPIILLGANFGPTSVSPSLLSVSFGQFGQYTASSCRVKTAHREIECLSVPGTGSGHNLTLVVAGQPTRSVPEAVSYGAPVVAYYEGAGASGGSTAGHQQVVVVGKNFGPIGNSNVGAVVYRHPSAVEGSLGGLGPTGTTNVSLSLIDGTAAMESLDAKRVVYQAVDCRVIVSHTRMSCTTVPGAGQGMQWVAFVDGQASVAPSTAYAPPQLLSISSSVSAEGALTDGGQDVTLRGANFGPVFELKNGQRVGFLSAVTYGPSRREYAARNCSVVSQAEIRCKTSAGVGVGHRWRVVVGGQESESYEDSQASRDAGLVLDYAEPVVTEMDPASGATIGGYVVRMRGTNLGIVDERRSSSAAAQGDDGASDSPLRVRFGESGGFAPVVATTRLASGEHQVDFFVPESDGGTRSVAIELSDPSGTVHTSNSMPFVFGSPVITEDIYAVRWNDTVYQLTVVGENFGLAPSVLVDGSPAQQCKVLELHSRVQCMYWASSGTVQVVTQTGLRSDKRRFDFASPSFLQGDGTPKPLLDTRGGTVMRLEGFNWQTDPTLVNVTVDGKPCPILPIGSPVIVLEDGAQSRYSLECKSPAGQGQGVPVIVTRAGQRSLPDFSWSYAPPEVVSVTPSSGIPTSGGLVVVQGSNLGMGGLVLVPGVSVVSTSWDHDTIAAVVGPGEGAGLQLSVDVSLQRSGSVAISYAPPAVTSWPTAGPTAGTLAAVVTGSNFGVAKPRLALRRLTATGQETLNCTLHSWNHTALVADLPPGTGAGWGLVVSAGNQDSAPASFSFLAPVVESVQANSSVGFPTAGGVLVRVAGSNLGRSLAGLRIRAAGDATADGGFEAQLVSQPSHSEAVFVLPEGQGEALQAVLTVDGLVARAIPFAYDPPRIDGIVLPESVPTEGTWRSQDPVRHEVMTITGSSFGMQSTQRTEVRILPAASAAPGRLLQQPSYQEFQAGIECPLTVQPDPDRPGKFTEGVSRRYGHSQIAAGIPAGYGRDLRLAVAVGGRISNVVPFAYDPPVLTVVLPNVPTAVTCPLSFAESGSCSQAAELAKGETVRILGSNFGETPPLAGELDVRIGGLPCSSQSWNRDGTLGGRPYLTCTVPWDTTGAKNVTVRVAGQSAEPWLASDQFFATACEPGAYGSDGEFCLQCPAGAACAGGSEDPVSLPGWFDIRPVILANDTNKEDDLFCPMERRDPSVRPYCFHPMPCEPKEACIGASLCATGYSGTRCSQCLPGEFYRINGACERCPENPWLIVALFVVVALVACVAGYVLNQRSVNVGLLAVGVDYFQVLAIFARTRVRWPAFIQQLFVALSAFNLNLELAAPECALPEFSYVAKWFLTMFLPLAAALVLGVTFALQLAYKRWVMGVRERSLLTTHAEPLVAVMVVVGVFLYLILTRTTLDVFNCSPTDPPDGDNLYMSGMLDIVCFESGTHLLLFPFAVGAAILYVAGFPVFVFAFVRRNLYSIKYDQILRARRIPPSSKLMPPDIKAFHSRWHRLYYLYRPGKAYWLVVILARKFLIAFAALAFRSTPTYQLAACILVLFASFTLQVRHSPYMSLSDHKGVVSAFLSFSDGAKKQSVQARVRKNMEAFESTFDVDDTRRRGGEWAVALRAIHKAKQGATALSADLVAEQVIDYNAVELVLLGCGILVNLAGIMFLSDRFADSWDGYYLAEYDALAVMVAAVVFASIAFFAFVLLVEVIYVASPACASRVLSACPTPKRALKTQGPTGDQSSGGGSHGAVDGASHEPDGPGARLRHNPLANFGSGKRDGTKVGDLPEAPPSESLWQMIRSGYQQNERQIRKLQAELDRLRLMQSAAEGVASPGVSPIQQGGRSPRTSRLSKWPSQRPRSRSGSLSAASSRRGSRSATKLVPLRFPTEPVRGQS
ncbi:hypothetical protein FNF29_05030 [Cafeteria roenbergensis]|uniref:Cadherin domain-containing protein n=1 Tax=Cafeteria roenbergensis TaxID=33653 RepID=A0A5A8CC42_CAFRO|nr:hypothetical protein FNF29_05030 [Cafeteria roenbergensis]|eukprot:KAA0150693.1 hypothetical protein FNF29_05030 [Cafeteria roenbergensis]